MRRREISPTFWGDERVWNLDSDAARLLLPGLWQLADRDGRLEDRPFDIGVKVRPWAPREAAGLIDQLVAAGLLVRYEVAGMRCLAFPSAAWKRHQRPHPKEAPSKLPAIPQGSEQGSTQVRAGEHLGDPLPREEQEKGGTRSVMPSGLQAFEPSGLQAFMPSAADLSHPKAKSKRTKAQVELPGVPPPPPPEPRERSNWEQNFALFDEVRREKMARSGVPSEPEHFGPAFINAALARISEKCRDHDEFTDVVSAYFAEAWPGQYDPPWGFKPFTSDKVWPKLLAKLRAAETPESAA